MKKGYLDIEKLTNEGWMLFRNIHTQNSIASEMRKLEYFAAPDVVEVVRCKDCVWWDEDDSAGWGDLGNNVCACTYFSNEDGYTVYTEPNDYCSKGLRMEDEG